MYQVIHNKVQRYTSPPTPTHILTQFKCFKPHTYYFRCNNKNTKKRQQRVITKAPELLCICLWNYGNSGERIGQAVQIEVDIRIVQTSTQLYIPLEFNHFMSSWGSQKDVQVSGSYSLPPYRYRYWALYHLFEVPCRQHSLDSSG